MTTLNDRCDDHIAIAQDGHTRVAVREIGETCYRALYSAGVSSGEAHHAAGVITAMEIHEGTGICAAVAQLSRPSGRRIPFRRTLTDTEIVLDDPIRRASLLIGPVAVDLAIADDRRVVIAAPLDHDVLRWCALEAAVTAGETVWLASHPADGSADRVSVATPEGDLYQVGELPRQSRPKAFDHAGDATCVLTAPLTTAPSNRVHTRLALDRRFRDALDHGVHVDATHWAHIRALGSRYLVPESTHES